MLITVEDAMAALGLTQAFEGDISATLTAAISKAQLRLEQELDTRLDRAANTDVFYVDPDIYCGVIPGDRFCLRLTQAFVDPTGLTVSSCDSRTGTFTTVDPTAWTLDPDLGLVNIDRVDPSLVSPSTLRLFGSQAVSDRQYFTVTYNAGFDTGAHKVNEAIKQALLAYVPVAFQIAAPTMAAAANPAYTLSVTLAASLIQRYVRRVSFSYRPIQNTRS